MDQLTPDNPDAAIADVMRLPQHALWSSLSMQQRALLRVPKWLRGSISPAKGWQHCWQL